MESQAVEGRSKLNVFITLIILGVVIAAIVFLVTRPNPHNPAYESDVEQAISVMDELRGSDYSSNENIALVKNYQKKYCILDGSWEYESILKERRKLCSEVAEFIYSQDKTDL